MLAWSLSGSLLLALAAPAAGDRATAVVRAEPSAKLTQALRREGYRMPVGREHVALVTDETQISTLLHQVGRDRRVPPSAALTTLPFRDPGAESVRLLLRDRLARRPGALDARVEWRLTGTGSDLGLGGGIARIVNTLVRD